MKNNYLVATLGVAAILLSPAGAVAQSANAGDIRGTATDASGALLPDVTVTVTNTGTGVSKTLTTNKDGLYDTGPIVTGNYSVTFIKDGFSSLNRTGLNLDVSTITVDGKLTVGSTSDTVNVNTDVALIQTETGEQSATLSFQSMNQLPNVGGNGPSWENFTTLIAGAAATPSAPLGNSPGQSVSVNGNLPYSSILSDGAESTLPSSANADVYVFETVQEVKVSTSAFSAQYGVGGILFNQISKGGTNRFHGSAYEYNQNDAYNARPYSFTSVPNAKNRVRFNNFGGSIGGPILKDRAFFYFNYDQINNNSAVNALSSVPTLAQRAGDFSAQLIPGITCAPTTAGGNSSPGCIYDPNSTTVVNGAITRTPFLNNQIPTGRFDKVAAAIQAFFPAPNRPGTVQTASFANGKYTPGFTSNNYYYQGTQSNPYKKYFGRLDFNLSDKNRLTATVAKRDNPAFFIGQDICPINCYAGDVDSTNAQITDVHSFSSNFINELRLGYTNQLNFFVGQSFGGGYPSKLGFQFAKADGFPQINYNSGLLGLGPGINAIYKEHVFDPSDVVTLIRGRHILHFGGEFLINEDNSTAWGNLNPGTFGFTGDYTKGSLNDKNSGLDYADFLLGTAHDWSAQVQPEYAGRQKTPQVFVQDDWKVRPNLTLNLGLRYQVQLGWKDAKNDQATFDPSITNPATNTPGAIWFAANKTNGRTALQQNKYDIVLPRVGFAYTVRPDLVMRGGVGLYSYNWSLDQYGQGQGQAILSSGNASDSTNGTAYVTTLAGNGSNLPFALQSTDPASKNGQSFNYVPYNTPVARSLQYNFGFEKQFGADMAVQIAYVGNKSYNLVFPSGINQLTQAGLQQAKANPSRAQSFRPFPQYQSLSGYQTGANSNYNSLQVSITKRFSHGFSFDTNYVWSKFLDDIDSSGWGSRAGTLQYQDPYNFHANYGPSNFDIRNAWKGSVIYQLPFGLNQQFLNHNRFADAVIGGWRVSSTFQLQDGNPFTPTINSQQTSDFALSGGSNFRLRPNLVGNPNPAHRTLLQYFDTNAYEQPAPYTYGNVHRNSLYGPGYESFNASIGKTFHYTETIGLSIRADVNNILNHPTFGVPNTDLTNGGGQITSTSNAARNMQLSARFAF
ncbi:carboxypeptidase-like regulatory domain-containing protein [Terriglobus aquaticus]|uniref:Carboxypeptidase regulatory-like domain-containing protein n=1 Tax=Terriglobus aquaticus TaxID=940139 RepID=A0ABW9KL98_9BACT|nr:carboxypeptidase-like regulatory domain-containing protein [Terriglobus aquaticus]